jgi:ABC-type sugar transport system substrate-binding protein
MMQEENEMKKAIAIILILALATSLFACSGGTDTPSSTGGDSESSAGGGQESNQGGGQEGSGAQWPAEAGYFDSTYDYSQHENFKVGYLIAATSFLYEEFDKAFADWAKRMNITYTGIWAPAGGSADEYLSGIDTFLDQGYDGLILDADPNWYPAIFETLEEAGVPYSCAMGEARDYAASYFYNNQLVYGYKLAPYVGFDQISFGYHMVDKLTEWKEAEFPDVPWEKVGLVSVDYSAAPQLHDRGVGAERRWAELHPEFGAYDPDILVNPKNFFVVDTLSGAPDQTTAQNLVTQVLSNPGDIEVWLIETMFDDIAMGAANAAQNLGMVDTTCVVTIGGSNIIEQWDAGVESAWRYAEFTAQNVYAEPIIASLWAMMAGQATPETLFPEWVPVWDKGDHFALSDEVDPIFGLPYVQVDDSGRAIVEEEHSFSTLLLPTFWIDKDNYKPYVEWTDLYAYGPGAEGHYKYEPVTDLGLFSARAEVPESYSQYPAPR